MNRFFSFALVAVVVLLAGRPALAQDGSAVIQRLQAKYDAIEALQASFTQTMTSPYYDGAETFSGTVLLSGDRYRVETGNQTLVTDGRVTWIYNASDNQVLINDATQDDTNFSLSDLLFNYEEHYVVTSSEAVSVNGQGHVKLNLKPKARDSFFRSVALWVRDQDTLVTRLEVDDVNETTMIFDLDDISLNPSLQANAFSFTPPQGAEVIDLRS